MTLISISEWLGKDAAGICGKRMKEILANGVAFGPVTMKDQSEELSVPIEAITRRIFLIRGQKVMLDSDLAELYQVQTKVLNQAAHRNEDRFPDDFLFQLTEEESSALRSQFVTLEKGRGRYSKYRPNAFTEHGVAMLSSVLRSKRAIHMNIAIVRAFIQLRELLATNKELAVRMEQLEATVDQHASVINTIAEEINNMTTGPQESGQGKRRIGFNPDNNTET